MSRLKTILQSKASKWIHVAIVCALVILGREFRLSYVLLALELWVLFKRDKTLLIYACIVAGIVYWRFEQETRVMEPEFPLTAEVVFVNEDYVIVEDGQRYRCYGENLEFLKPGMMVLIEGQSLHHESFDIMSSFDYDRYLRSQNIQGTIFIRQINVISQNFHIGSVRYQLLDSIDHRYPDTMAFYIKLLLFGQRDDGYDALRDDASQLGITHLFAISGMHLGMLVSMLNMILRKFYLAKENQRMMVVLFLGIYNLLTGFLVSIIRASLLLVGIYAKEYGSIVLTKADLLSFSFIGLIIWQPYILFNLGFQLSYLIAFSIILGHHLIKANNKIKSTMLTTLLATAFSLPLVLHVSGQLSLFFLPYNLFFIFFVSLVFLPTTVAVFIFPILAPFYQYVTHIFEHTLDFAVNMNQSISFHFTQPVYALIYWILIVLWLIFRQQAKKRLLVFYAFIMLFLMNILIPFKAMLFVRFLDIGQGDAIHLYNRGTNLLIDTGDQDKFHRLAAYFTHHQIKRIDILVITHLHEDHYGELSYFLQNFEIRALYLNQDIGPQAFDYQVLSAGDNIQIKDITLHVLNADTDSENENNNALVLYGIIGLDTYLFTADIETEIETKLLQTYQLDIDVLKVAHHGSNTSSSKTFIEQISPDYAVISVGEENSFNHPHPQVIDQLEKSKSVMLRTDLDGTITFYYYPVFQTRLIETFHFQKLPRYLL